MKKVNLQDIIKHSWTSPKGKFHSMDREISVALGRNPESLNARERHPFDVEVCYVPPGKASCPYHSHSAQTEFYYVLSGTGLMRHAGGTTPLEPGDSCIFHPGEPHQLLNDGETELAVMIVADNPIGESCHYPDSKKWLVRSPARHLIRSESLDYLDGEE